MKFLSVEVKSGETQDKLKAKVLKALHNSEKNALSTSSPLTHITHPLQPWTGEVHTFPDLKAEEVIKAAANSSYIAFLLQDGHVCRVRVSSWDELSGGSGKMMSIDALRRSQQGTGSSFQVLGDEEYARQLQTDLNSGRMPWESTSGGGGRGGGSEQRLPPFVVPFGGRLAGNVDEFVPLHGSLELQGSLPFAGLEDSTLTNEWRCVCVCACVHKIVSTHLSDVQFLGS